jgi:hypothetical protein
MLLDDVIDPKALTLADVGVTQPHLLEHTAIEFIRRFRPNYHQEDPLTETQ